MLKVAVGQIKQFFILTMYGLAWLGLAWLGHAVASTCVSCRWCAYAEAFRIRADWKCQFTLIRIFGRKGTPFESPIWVNLTLICFRTLCQPPVVFGPSGSGELKIKAKNGKKNCQLRFIRMTCVSDVHRKIRRMAKPNVYMLDITTNYNTIKTMITVHTYNI